MDAAEWNFPVPDQYVVDFVGSKNYDLCRDALRAHTAEKCVFGASNLPGASIRVTGEGARIYLVPAYDAAQAQADGLNFWLLECPSDEPLHGDPHPLVQCGHVAFVDPLPAAPEADPAPTR